MEHKSNKSNVLQKMGNTLEILLFLHRSIKTFRNFGHFKNVHF